MSNSECERRKWGGSGEEELEVLAMHWEGKGVPVRGNVPIDNIKSKAREVCWMMEPVGRLLLRRG